MGRYCRNRSKCTVFATNQQQINHLPQNHVHSFSPYSRGMRSVSITKFVTVLLIFLTSASWNIHVGSAIQPETTGNKYGDFGFDTTLRCLWTGVFSRLEWRTSVKNETDFFEADLQVQYTPPDTVLYRNEENFSFDKSDPGNPLTIKNFTKDDVARYWCRLDTSPSSDSNFLDLFMREPVTIDKSSVKLNGEEVISNKTLNVKEGLNHELNFSVTGILPNATFEWMLGSMSLPETTVDTPQGDGLITSTSTATWTSAAAHNGEVLKCTASNGAPEDVIVEFNIKIDKPTQEPPGDFPIWIIVVIVVVICVAIVITIVVICRCKQKGHDEGRVDNGSDTPMK